MINRTNRKVLCNERRPGFHTVNVFVRIRERVNSLKGSVQKGHALLLQGCATADTAAQWSQ